MIIKKLVFVLIMVQLFHYSFVPLAEAKIKWKKPKIDLSMAGGYDSNILRVSQEADSNRMAGTIYNLDASLIEWIYWNRQIRSYISLTGDYLMFPGQNIDDNWSFLAKIKTIGDLTRHKTGTWIPGIQWSLQLRYARIDRYYSDRAAGAEFTTLIDRISGRRLRLGDLFDRTTFRIFAGIDFSFNPWLRLGIGIQQEFKNYTDIGVPGSEDFFSLDNDETKFFTNLMIKPVKDITLRAGYNHASRVYDHKIANDADGKDLQDINREYNYNELDVSLQGGYSGLTGIIRYLDRKRIDIYEGYFDYNADKISIQGRYQINRQWQISAYYEAADKKYAHVTLSGRTLENEYLTLESWIAYNINTDLRLQLNYTFEKENSTYSKFTYQRNIISLRLEYLFR